MPRYRARAEFRRRDTDSEWVLAGVIVRDRFWPARPGVEPVARRLPRAGLLGWAELPTPVVAASAAQAAAVALEVARATWPARDRPLPYED